MGEKPQVLVIGYADDHCPDSARKLAYEVGCEIARRGGILITGGLKGVMEAASRGAKENGGLVVGIIPQEDKAYANPYCDVVVCTGMGWARDFITAYTADAVIIVGGGAGTLIEAIAAYFKLKPIVALRGSGGTADKYAGGYLDDRKAVKVWGENTPGKAVDRAFQLLKGEHR
jgi:hypothetical protein